MSRRSASVDIEVNFYHLDPLEIVWHGNYLRFFEKARQALLRSFDYDYPQMRESGYAWPIVDVQIKYVQAARYGQTLRVTATLVEWENRLRMRYEIRDRDTGQRLTKGETTQVAVAMDTGELQFVAPPVLLERLTAHPAGAAE